MKQQDDNLTHRPFSQTVRLHTAISQSAARRKPGANECKDTASTLEKAHVHFS
jgi:hypothetical protein